eukprot:16449930-Heterocapsa_arctica.AAC.1
MALGKLGKYRKSEDPKSLRKPASLFPSSGERDRRRRPQITKREKTARSSPTRRRWPDWPLVLTAFCRALVPCANGVAPYTRPGKNNNKCPRSYGSSLHSDGIGTQGTGQTQERFWEGVQQKQTQPQNNCTPLACHVPVCKSQENGKGRHHLQLASCSRPDPCG